MLVGLILIFKFVIIVDGCARMSNPSSPIVGPVTTTQATPVTEDGPNTRPTTTQPITPCNAPANTAGLTIDEGIQIIDDGLQVDAVDHCTSCDSGDRNFYTSATTADPVDAQGIPEVAKTVRCDTLDDICMCNDNGVCCSPDPDVAMSAPDQILMIPYCDDSGCFMNAYMQGSGTTRMLCTDGSVHTVDNQGSPTTPNMVQPMNTAAYFQADSVSCSGCSAIEDNICMGPLVDGPAAGT